MVISFNGTRRVGYFSAVLTFALAISSGSAFALDFKKQQIAQGLAEILSNAENCGYEIDDAAIEAYYVKVGLDTPEGLAFVTNMVSLNEMGGKKSEKTACTLARTTAKSIGVLVKS